MASRPLSILELVTLREYAPLEPLFKLIPRKAQRALTLSQSNIDVEWTCVDASSEFIVLGSNISLVYLFDRQELQLAKLKCEDKSCQVSCVKLLTCLDHQLAVGTSSGHIEIFLLPSRSHGHAIQAKRFVLEHLHQTVPVTCVEWSNNGMKLFSGDTQGKVVQTDIDFYENQCRASVVATEAEAVVQLSYAHKKLLISTTGRTVVCTPDDDNRIQQVGQQLRKSKGSFGAHFVPGLCKPSDATLYISRPGWRLWHANTEGVVLETIMFKDMIGAEHPLIKLLPGTAPPIIPPPNDLQLGHLLPFSCGLLVSWSLSSIVVLQPCGPEGALVVASNFGELGSIVSVAVTRYEIFVLRKGCDRCLVRIATAPEIQLNKEPSRSERDFGKMQTIKMNLVENASQMTLVPSVPVSTDRMTSTKLKNKFNSVRGFFSKAADELTDKAVETKNKMERNLERSFKLNLNIPARQSEDNVSVKSDRSSVNGDEDIADGQSTPEAMLSERLMVSVINASTMRGDRSPTGRSSPTAPFRTPTSSFSGCVSSNGGNLPADETPQPKEANRAEVETPGATGTTGHGPSETVGESGGVESNSNLTGSNATMGDTQRNTDRLSILITEDPQEDQSEQVVQNLSKRESAAFKISKDTLNNIDDNFADSIVFQPKPKSKMTKKKKKTVKGANGVTNNAESRPKTGTSLSCIQEGETFEEGNPSEDVLAERLDDISESKELRNGTAKSATTYVDGGNVGSDITDSEKMFCYPVVNLTHKEYLDPDEDAMNEESIGNLKRVSYAPELNPFTKTSPPRSLQSAPRAMNRTANRISYDIEMNPFNGLQDVNPSGERVVSYTANGKELKTDGNISVGISLPKSLHSIDSPRNDDHPVSPILSPRSPRSPISPRSPRGLSRCEQSRRLGVVMEDFDVNAVPEGGAALSPARSPVLVCPGSAEEDADEFSDLPVIPPRKNNKRLEKVKIHSYSSRPVSEFEDIYSTDRRTTMMGRDSIHEEEIHANTENDELKGTPTSDNSEAESQDSDDGEEAEASLPESIQQKLAGSWMQCATPNYIYQLLASERHIWYVDSRDKAHHCLSTDIACKWSKLKEAPCRLIAVSPSGSIVWRVNPKTNVAFSSTAITQRSPVGYRWIEVCRDVSHLCLDENMAWIIKQNGQLCVQKGLSRDKPYTRDMTIESNVHLVQISSCNGVVWARTAKDKVVYRTGITSKRPEGQLWEKLPDDENLKMVCIALDSRNTGWAIDDAGLVWFRTGVTMDKPSGDDQKWWQVCMSEYLMEDPNVLRMMVNMAGSATKVDRVVNWLKKQCYKATAITANSTGVWVCSSYHYKTTLHVSKGNLLGSRWELSNPIGLAASATWKCVCASPSYGPSGMIWVLQTGGEIFCFSSETRKPNLVQSPDDVIFDYISATTNAVWALSTRNEVYVRMEITERCPGGTKWKRLDLNQFGSRSIVHFTLGSDVVWAVDSMGGVHFRLGVLLPKLDALPLAWVPVDGKPVGYGVCFTHVFCGPTNDVVWAVDNKKTVYARQGVSKNMPVGLGWEPVEGTQAHQLCMSTESVWALCPNGELACRFGISGDNATGDYWKKIPGDFKHVTVSQNDELWTINSDGRLFHRLTKMFIRCAATKAAAMETRLEHDDWELL